MNGIVIHPPLKIIDKIIDKLPFSITKDNLNSFSQIVIASIMEDLYSSYNILTIPQDRVIKKEDGSIERFAYLAIKPSCIVSDKEIDYFLDSLDKCLEKGTIKLIGSFLKQKIS